jgi:hypothetical protein
MANLQNSNSLVTAVDGSFGRLSLCLMGCHARTWRQLATCARHSLLQHACNAPELILPEQLRQRHVATTPRLVHPFSNRVEEERSVAQPGPRTLAWALKVSGPLDGPLKLFDHLNLGLLLD